MISIKQQENYLTLKQHGDDSRISPKEAQQLDNVVIQTAQLSSSLQRPREMLLAILFLIQLPFQSEINESTPGKSATNPSSPSLSPMSWHEP